MSVVSRFIALFVFLTTFSTQPATSTTTATTLAKARVLKLESPGSFSYMYNFVFCDHNFRFNSISNDFMLTSIFRHLLNEMLRREKIADRLLRRRI